MVILLDDARLQAVDANTLEITSLFYIEDIKDSNGNITELQIKKQSIRLKDTFKIDLEGLSSLYTVNFIKKIEKNHYLLFNEIKNKTTKYLLPVLDKVEIPKRFKKDLTFGTIQELESYCKNTYLVNCYLGINSDVILKDHLYLKYRHSGHSTYSLFEQLIVEHPLFVETIDDNYFTYFKFKIPKEFRDDIEIFIDGAYSELSEYLKHRIISFKKLQKNSNEYMILYKSPEFKQTLEKYLNCSLEGQELEDIPEIINETIEI